jgi:pimeloyl-ACP methyl ester carboxylesterase
MRLYALIVAVPAAAYSIVLAAFAMLQERLLYHPGRIEVAAAVTLSGAAAWPSSGDFRGLLAQPPAGPVRATAIVFHGNGGHAAHRAHYAATLNRLSLRVILAEYPGYGPRPGAPSEASLVADAAATIERAEREYGRPLLVVGESLGAGVAAAAARREADKVDALLLIAPWDRLDRVAAYHYPWLPVRWLLRDTFDSAAHLANIGRPVLVAVGEGDTVVPARFGVSLYAQLAQPKRLAVIPGAEHNQILERLDAAWWREAIAFLLG